jgi:hypothetical protein
MSNEKIKPGDVLFDGQLKEYTVTKVGTKFVYVKAEYTERKLEMCNLWYQDYKGKYHRLYRDKQTASDETEAAKLFDLVRMSFVRHYNHKSANLTLAQLRQIAEVLGIDNQL